MKAELMKKKRQIKSYQQALNEAFSSSFGGGSPVLGISSNHYKGYRSGGGTPHQGRTMTGQTGYDLRIIQKEEEMEHKAPDLLPFPLDLAFDHVTDVIMSMDKLHAQLNIATENNVILSDASNAKLKRVKEYVKDTLSKFIKVGKMIEQCNLSDTIG